MHRSEHKKNKRKAQDPHRTCVSWINSPFDARPWAGPALLAAFTLLLWFRTAGFPLLYWDDSVYLFSDPRLNALTPANLRAILTRPFFANYHPVTTLTFLWDRLLWKSWIPGFHLTQMSFYAGSVVLSYFFILSFVRTRFWAFLGAALFSAHALHVEPVAWLAGRKDVVCLFFSVASLCLYARYARLRDGGFDGSRELRLSYFSMLGMFVLALGSKGYAAALPLVFIAYDACSSVRFSWRLVFDKLPLLALALGLILVTFLAQDETSALIKDASLKYQLDAVDRLTLLLKIFCLYAGRSLLPVDLSSTYVVSKDDWMPGWVAFLGLLLFCALIYGFFRTRRTLPAIALGSALFVLPQFTTLNTFFTLRIWMADRYILIPTLGLALALSGLGACLGERMNRRSLKLLLAASGCLLLIHSALSLDRMEVWSSASLLHSDALRKNFPTLSGDGIVTAEEVRATIQDRPVPPTMLDLLERLSLALQREGQEEQSSKLTELLIDSGYSGLGMGVAELKRGNLDKAIECFTNEIKRGEWYGAKAAKLLGDTYRRKGQPELARAWYRQSASLYQRQGLSTREARLGEGDLEFGLRNLPEALESFQLLSNENPGDPLGPFCIGRTLEAMGNLREAYGQYEKAAAMPASSFNDRYLSLADVRKRMGLLAEKMESSPHN